MNVRSAGIAPVLVGIAMVRIANGAGGVAVGLFLSSPQNLGSGADATTAGVLGAVSFAAELAGALPLGILADLSSPGLFMSGGALLGSAGILLFAFGSSMTLLYVARALEGLAAAASTPSTLAYLTRVTDRSPRIRGRVMSYFELALLAGIALGGPVAAFLWTSMGRSAFLALAGIYGAAAILLYSGSRGEGRGGVSGGGISFRGILGNREMLRLVPAWLSMNAVVGLWLGPVLPFLLTAPSSKPQYLAGIFADDPARVGWVMLVYSAVFAAGVFLWSFVLDRLRRKTVLQWSLAAMTGVCICLAILNRSEAWTNPARLLLISAAAVLVMVESAFTPAALTLLSDAVASQTSRTTIMAFYSVLLSLGALAGSLAGGVAGSWFAIDGLIGATLVFVALSFLAVRAIPERA